MGAGEQKAKPDLLVVDDSAPMRLWLQKTLGERFAISETGSLMAAIKAYQDHSFDLILIDAALPDGSGLDFCRLIRQHPTMRSVPILMITATGDESLISEAFEAGCSDFVRKPIRPPELFARIDLAMKLKVANERIEELIQELRERSERDPLTGLFNRHALYERSILLLQEPYSEIGALMVDVDNFKACNDMHGHQLGDDILCSLAGSLQSNLPPNAIVARYGGDEFVVILPKHNLQGAAQVAHRLWSGCQSSSSVTVSVGYSSIMTLDAKRPAELLLTELLQQCDEALYHAKRCGKNQVRNQPRIDPCAQQSPS